MRQAWVCVESWFLRLEFDGVSLNCCGYSFRSDQIIVGIMELTSIVLQKMTTPVLIHESHVFRVFTRYPNGIALEYGSQTGAFSRRSPAAAGSTIKRKFRWRTPKRQCEEVKTS